MSNKHTKRQYLVYHVWKRNPKYRKETVSTKRDQKLYCKKVVVKKSSRQHYKTEVNVLARGINYAIAPRTHPKTIN